MIETTYAYPVFIADIKSVCGYGAGTDFKTGINESQQNC